MICATPARAETDQKLSQVRREQSALEAREDSLDAQLEMRKKHFHALVQNIHQLQVMIKQHNKWRESRSRKGWLLGSESVADQSEIFCKMNLVAMPRTLRLYEIYG